MLQVITPSAGGPAERAGIEPQDVLLAIGDRPLQNVSLYEAGDLLQGTEGTEVCLFLGSPGGLYPHLMPGLHLSMAENVLHAAAASH